MSSTTIDLELEHNGKFYIVVADVDLELQDDSFDHEFGTEEVLSCSMSDWSADVTEVAEDGTETDVDYESDNELYSYIEDKLESEVSKLDASDFFSSGYYDDDPRDQYYYGGW